MPDRDPNQCNELKKAVDRAKAANTLGRCLGTDNKADLERKLRLWMAEYTARTVYEAKCYDNGHEQSIAQAKTNVDNCNRFLGR